MLLITSTPTSAAPSKTEELLLELLVLAGAVLDACEFDPCDVPLGDDPFDALPARLAHAVEVGEVTLVSRLRAAVEFGGAVRRARGAESCEELALAVMGAREHARAATARPLELVGPGKQSR